jgi:accessory gene regulator protein AgrB
MNVYYRVLIVKTFSYFFLRRNKYGVLISKRNIEGYILSSLLLTAVGTLLKYSANDSKKTT